MRQILAFIIAAVMLVVACATPAILIPRDNGPCGIGRHMCSDGMCCGNGFACTVERIPSMYRDPPGHGFCTWGPE